SEQDDRARPHPPWISPLNVFRDIRDTARFPRYQPAGDFGALSRAVRTLILAEEGTEGKRGRSPPGRSPLACPLPFACLQSLPRSPTRVTARASATRCPPS